MGYQFFHLEAYARVGSRQERVHHKTKKPYVVQKLSIDEVVAEAERAPSAAPHVANPKPPIRLHGCSPSEAAERAKTWAEGVRDSKGRKMRKDGLCLAAGVISMPDEMRKDWPRYREAVVRWLKKQYGDRLLSVVDHQDENHPHLHFYAVARDGESFDRLHPGRTAAAAAAARGADKKTQRVEYMNAMRAWQDDFSRECAANFGLARLGPGRRRLSRAEWKREQAQAKAFAHPEMPKSLLLSERELEPRVVDKAFFLPIYETPGQVAVRVNAGQKKKLQDLSNAAIQGQKAIQEADGLAKEVAALRSQNRLMQAKNEELQARMSMFTPAEIEAAQERQQKLHEAEQMKQAEAFLAAQETQSKNNELLRLAAENMVAAGEEISIEKALAAVDELLAGGYEQELLKWVDWKPAERPPEPLQPAERPAARERDDGPEFGR